MTDIVYTAFSLQGKLSYQYQLQFLYPEIVKELLEEIIAKGIANLLNYCVFHPILIKFGWGLMLG